jgi:N-acetylglutamate synthase-like GNAT family acetyltransferase
MHEIRFERSRTISGAELASLFARSGINRPTGDPQRMQQMADTANLLMTAWDGDCLVGVARSLTDFCAACYLADLAVDNTYQRRGIGAQLVQETRSAIGSTAMLLLLAAPTAMAYYPKIGFTSVDNGWIIRQP